MEKAMALAVVFSEKKEYTKVDPLKIQMDKGVHEIVGNNKVLNVTCNHITFVGKGKDHTTLLGGFKVENQQNVKFEELAVTHPDGDGLVLTGKETTVDMLKCSVKECKGDGLDCAVVPFLQQHNVNLWRMMVVECTVFMLKQKQD